MSGRFLVIARAGVPDWTRLRHLVHAPPGSAARAPLAAGLPGRGATFLDRGPDEGPAQTDAAAAGVELAARDVLRAADAPVQGGGPAQVHGRDDQGARPARGGGVLRQL